ncbi:MAG: RpiB/LacA/LacB family sugar-phosphate isomerase [Moorea sp. SIO4G2]|nr:RpiB/LacA/LacB family sugar-phosphate isomerase [Moorena sp. SIO4G2]
MKIAVGADSYGFDLKQAVKEYLINKGIEIEDVAINEQEAETPYYQIASEVAQRVGNQQADRGILVCGTGMGMAIIANKHPGVYAAVCENTNAAEKSRSINNSNVLTLGGFITSPEVAVEIVDTWLTTEFTSGWEPPIQEWLENSIKDIAILENEQFGSIESQSGNS